MKKLFAAVFTLILMLNTLAVGAAASGNEVAAVDGYTVITAKDCSETEKYAAEVMAKYVNAITGADTAILDDFSEDNGAEIVIGETSRKTIDVSGLEDLPKVGVAYFHIDADPAVLETMMDKYEGVVIAGAGNGSSSTLWSNVVKDRVDGGDETIVVRTGRMDNGIVTDNANYMQSIAANNLNPQKARILLALALTQTKDREQIRQYFAEY